MALASGHKLGSFEITTLIGVGGMGEVYRAQDTRLGREVAIKVLPQQLASDPERLGRFEREARILAALDHPKIGALYDFQRDGDVQYLVLQLVEGETLADRLARGPLLVDEAVAIFTQIAEALEAAHEAGIVHRDLKPANVKISPDDSVKVLDFGIARAAEERVAGIGSPRTVGLETDTAPTLTFAPTPVGSLTSGGTLVGTPDFMSPEQARGKPVDRRTDIWAFGVCLYQALVGRLPFEGETLTDQISAILRDDVDFSALPPEVPRRLQKLLRRCLEKDPRFRLRDIGEAWIVLRSEEVEEGSSVSRGVAPVVRFGLALPSGHRLSTFSIPLAVSNDGETLVVATFLEGIRRLLVRRLDDLETRELEDTLQAYLPFFSPDGDWVGFFRRRQLRRVRVEGGPVETLADLGARAIGGVWTPAGEILWSELGGGIRRMPAAGGEIEVLTEPNRERGESHHMPVGLGPGPDEVLSLVQRGVREEGSVAESSLEAVSLTTAERRPLQAGVHAPCSLTADGTLVFSRNGSLFALPDFGRSGSAEEPVQVLGGLDTNLDQNIAYYALSSAGTLVYARNQRREESSSVCWVSRQGDRRTVPLPPNFYLGPQVSPDGEQLVLVCNDAGGRMQVFFYDLHRRLLEQITREGKRNVCPVWHPQGHGLAYCTDSPTRMHFFSLEDGRTTPLPGTGDPEWPSSYSPDGQFLAFTRFRAADHVAIEMLNVESGEIEPFVETYAHNFCPKFDPAGELVAYVSDESGRWEVYLKPFRGAGRRLRVSVDGGADPVWSPRGDELFYRSGDTVLAVRVERGERLRVGKPEPLFDFPFGGRASLFAPSFGVHPDGDRFIVTDAVAESQGATELVVVVGWDEELRRQLEGRSGSGSAAPIR